MNEPVNDYWTLTNISYQHWMKFVLNSRTWPGNTMFQAMACRAQADYVMYSALEKFEINHGNRKA